MEEDKEYAAQAKLSDPAKKRPRTLVKRGTGKWEMEAAHNEMSRRHHVAYGMESWFTKPWKIQVGEMRWYLLWYIKVEVGPSRLRLDHQGWGWTIKVEVGPSRLRLDHQGWGWTIKVEVGPSRLWLDHQGWGWTIKVEVGPSRLRLDHQGCGWCYPESF